MGSDIRSAEVSVADGKWGSQEMEADIWLRSPLTHPHTTPSHGRPNYCITTLCLSGAIGSFHCYNSSIALCFFNNNWQHTIYMYNPLCTNSVLRILEICSRSDQNKTDVVSSFCLWDFWILPLSSCYSSSIVLCFFSNCYYPLCLMGCCVKSDIHVRIDQQKNLFLQTLWCYLSDVMGNMLRIGWNQMSYVGKHHWISIQEYIIHH